MAVSHISGKYDISCDEPKCTSSFTVQIENYTGDEFQERGWTRDIRTGAIRCHRCSVSTKAAQSTHTSV